MAGIKFLADLDTQNPIQFKNSSGTDAGKIEMDGDDLVLSNAVGDILFGDADSDIYIGDGVNSVDILFEQNGEIRGETGSSVTLTIGSSDTTLNLYSPKITNLSTQSSEATALMINGSNVVGTRELGSLAFVSNISNSNWSGTDLAIANGGTGASTASAARTNLGLGTAATANSTSFASASHTHSTSDITSGTFPTARIADNAINAAKLNVSGNGTSGQVLASDGDGSFSWTSAGGSGTVTSVGTTGSVNGITLTGTVTSSGNLTLGGTLSISNSDWSGTDLSIANGGTGASTASAARTNLGLGTAATSASTDFVAVSGDTVTGNIKFNDNVRLDLGTSSDLQMYHSGTDSVIQNETGQLFIQNTSDDKDIIFRSDDGSGGLTEYFRLDGSDSQTVVSKNIKFYDNAAAWFGNGNDLRIYHDGSNSYIDETGTGNLVVRANAQFVAQKYTGETMFKGIADGAVELYYNNVKKFNTTAAGGTISGALTITQAGTNVLSLFNTTNGTGVAIEMSDQSSSAQKGYMTYRHSDGQSEGGGASFHFTSEPDTVLVVGDSTNKGRFAAHSANSGAEVDYGFAGDVNTGMYQVAAGQVGLVSDGSKKLNVSSNGVTIENGRFYLGGTVDTNTSSTTALVLNGTEVEKRTLGSAAFSASTDFVSATGSDTMSGTLTMSTSAVPFKFVETGHTGTGKYWRMPLDGGNIRFDVDVTNTNGDGSFASYTDVLLLKANGDVQLSNYGAGILKTDSSGNISLDTNTYLTAHPSISAASSVNNSGRTYIQDITVDSNGHVTGITSATETVTNTNTQLSNEQVQDIVGAMVSGNTETNISVTYDDTNGKLNFASTDTNTQLTDAQVRSKISGTGLISYNSSTGVISTTANNYSLPAGSSSTRGGFKIGYTENGKNYPVEVSSEKMYVNVPWTDTNTTYSTATSSTLGLVKIGYTENGKNYPVELSSGQMYVNVPWTDTNTTYSVGDGGLTQKNFTTTLKTKLDGIATSADNYSNWNLLDNADNTNRIDSNEYVKFSGADISGTGTSSDPFIVTTPNTTYTADGNYGMTLNGTAFRLENDRRRNSSTQDIHTGNTHDYTFYDADVGIRWYTAGAEEMRLEDDGDLHVDGDVIAFSTTVSDERLKDDVETIENASEKVSKLRGVEYTWNEGSRKGQREIGVIAQEVEEVVPEIVHEKTLPFAGDKTYKTVDYEKLVALLIESNKEQQEIIAQLEERIIDLENRL